MNNLKQGRKFSRKIGPRKALLKSLVESLILEEKITTTEAKAKEIKRISEKMMTMAKKGDLASRRHLLSKLRGVAVKKMMDDLAPQYKKRPGGYTRILKLGPRISDGAKMAIIELVK